MSVHILGVGSVGTLLAFHLRKANPTLPITLLLKDASSRSRFLSPSSARSAGALRVELPTRLGGSGSPEEQTGFDVETVFDGGASQTSGRSGEKIQRLLAMTKCQATLEAMLALRPRLDQHSTVTLLQNGMGVKDLLEDEAFWDEKTKPAFVLASTTLGARSQGPFDVVHEGFGDLSFATAPSSRPPPPSTASTLSLLSSLSSLSPCQLPYPSLESLLLRKLAVNACINPLTALLSFPNGHLATNRGSTSPIISSICHEISELFLDSPSHPPLVSTEEAAAFAPQELEKAVWEVVKATESNRSSMLQDLEAGRETEIEFISGWVVRMGRERGVDTPVNQRMYEGVKTKSSLDRTEIR